MRNKNNSNLIYMLYVFLLVSYHIVVFILIKNRGSSFWSAYIFTIIAWILLFGNTYYLSQSGGFLVENTILSWSPMTFSLLYVSVQTFFSIIIILIINFNNNISIILQGLLLIIYITLTILVYFGRNIATKQIMDTNTKFTFIDVLNKKLKILQQDVTDPELNIKIEKLLETINYSEPASTASTREVEKEIERDLSNLERSILDNDYTEVSSLIDKMKRLINKRSQYSLFEK